MSESNPKAENLTWHRGRVKAEDRDRLLRQRGCVVWLTGLSGSGKSTIACALEELLIRDGHLCYVLDGDNVRHGLNKDLGFSAQDREENIRRIGEVGALFAQAGVITIAAFISPYAKGRNVARHAAGENRFFEVFLDTPLEACESRDPKGLYQKVRAGEISDFTGVDAPYEKPAKPELIIDTSAMDVAPCAERIVQMLEKNGVFSV